MPTAFLVVGAESSGTRLMTQILVDAGCLGTATHKQPFDDELPPAEQDIVWRRSVPHARKWPDLRHVVKQARDMGYSVRAVWIMRDVLPCARSQVRIGHTASIAEAEKNIAVAIQAIATQLGALQADVPTEIVTYAGLVKRPQAVLDWLMPRLGLPVPDTHIVDADEKWWKT